MGRVCAVTTAQRLSTNVSETMTPPPYLQVRRIKVRGSFVWRGPTALAASVSRGRGSTRRLGSDSAASDEQTTEPHAISIVVRLVVNRMVAA